MVSAGTSFTSSFSPKRRFTQAGSLRLAESIMSSPIAVATSARMRSPSSSHGTTSAGPACGISTAATSAALDRERMAALATARELRDLLGPVVLHGRVAEHLLELVGGLLDVARVPERATAEALHVAAGHALGQLERLGVVELRERDARAEQARLGVLRGGLEGAVDRGDRVVEVAACGRRPSRG